MRERGKRVKKKRDREKLRSLSIKARDWRQPSEFKCSVEENRRSLERWLQARAQRIGKHSRA